jgi:hypothetical protein
MMDLNGPNFSNNSKVIMSIMLKAPVIYGLLMATFNSKIWVNLSEKVVLSHPIKPILLPLSCLFPLTS